MTESATALARELLARCRYPAAGATVACAVSGGADSTALMLLAVEAGCEVTAVHVDHGLRPGSASEAEVVARSAQAVGARFRSVRAEVTDGPNLEARAREARYSALPGGALTGHTMDDQAETVLLAMMRGAGLRGLAGMDRDRRPMLGLRRAETVELCRASGLEVVEDASNLDLRFRRNRVRHELLPMLCDIAERDVVPLLARQADLVDDDDRYLEQLAQSVDPGAAEELAAAEAPLARRAVRRWLGEAYPPSLAEVSRVLDIATGSSRATQVSSGRRVERRSGRMILTSPEQE